MVHVLTLYAYEFGLVQSGLYFIDSSSVISNTVAIGADPPNKRVSLMNGSLCMDSLLILDIPQEAQALISWPASVRFINSLITLSFSVSVIGSIFFSD